jgi:hypothetical protein
MDELSVFPNSAIHPAGVMSQQFLSMGIDRFHAACRYVHQLPYGYNADRDDAMSLFKEGKGTCTTKHAVIATLASETNLPITKTIGIYAMTESIVTGTNTILSAAKLPYVPMIHCFLSYKQHRVDLTEGNRNGKNCSIESFLHTAAVDPGISEKDEYLLFRNALVNQIMKRRELQGIKMRAVLKAREAGLLLLKSKLD